MWVNNSYHVKNGWILWSRWENLAKSNSSLCNFCMSQKGGSSFISSPLSGTSFPYQKLSGVLEYFLAWLDSGFLYMHVRNLYNWSTCKIVPHKHAIRDITSFPKSQQFSEHNNKNYNALEVAMPDAFSFIYCHNCIFFRGHVLRFFAFHLYVKKLLKRDTKQPRMQPKL